MWTALVWQIFFCWCPCPLGLQRWQSKLTIFITLYLTVYRVLAYLQRCFMVARAVSIDQCDEKDIKISYQYSFKLFRASILLFHGISANLLTWLLSKAFQWTKWNFFFSVWWLNYISPRRSAILQYLCRTQKWKQSESYEEYAHCIPKFYRCLLSCSLSFFFFFFPGARPPLKMKSCWHYWLGCLVVAKGHFTGVYLLFCFLPWNKLCNPVKMHNRLLEHGNELFELYFMHGNWVSFLDFLFNVTWMY